MQINKDTYQVLLPQKFWEESKNKTELKQKIEQYFNISYRDYKVEKIVQSGESYMAICVRG